MLFLSGLVQNRQQRVQLNMRLRWEYRPAASSSSFVEGATSAAASHLENRSFVVKVNRLLRF